MPVTFRPAPWHKAEALDAYTARVMSAQELLSMSCGDDAVICDEILQSSLGRGADARSSDRLSPAEKGLVTTISDAYEKHRALVLRPDDVWLAILCQFYRYVNAHAEELRSKFVAHQGKIDLTVVRDPGTRHTLSFDDMARDMTREMNKHIVDPTVRTWILPGFSTTTANDTVVAAVTMMATMKVYFRYVLRFGCGLPQVTLEGSKADWEAILLRAAKLKEYGEEPTRWYEMLAPVLTRFVRAFDDPEGADNLDFWEKVLHSQGSGGSNPKWLSGWITAFCVFGKDGKWIGPSASEPPTPGTMKEVKDKMREVYPNEPKVALELDGVLYPVIGEGSVPSGYAEVDVKLDDNGVKLDAKMIAGLVASRVSNSQDLSLSLTGKSDTIAPFPGWWIFTAKEEPSTPFGW